MPYMWGLCYLFNLLGVGGKALYFSACSMFVMSRAVASPRSRYVSNRSRLVVSGLGRDDGERLWEVNGGRMYGGFA